MWRSGSWRREAQGESGEVKRSDWASRVQFPASHPVPDNTASPVLTQEGSVVRGKGNRSCPALEVVSVWHCSFPQGTGSLSEMSTPNKAVQDVCSVCCATAVHVGCKAEQTTQRGLEEKQTACQETHLYLFKPLFIARPAENVYRFCFVRNNGYLTLQERKHGTKAQYALKGQEMVCWVQGPKIHGFS